MITAVHFVTSLAMDHLTVERPPGPQEILSNTPPKNGHGGNDRWTKYKQNINKISNSLNHLNGGKQ